MKLTIVKTVAALIISSALAFAEEAPQAASDVLKTLLAATESGDYPAFQRPGDAAFQAGITKAMFSQVSQQLAPMLKAGYDLSFLTSLTQQGNEVYLWKISPKTGQDQFVAKLVLKNGKATGFWIQ
ncbi:MAG: hypothetical protein ACKOF3_13305 [Spartobacteria bacterium]